MTHLDVPEQRPDWEDLSALEVLFTDKLQGLMELELDFLNSLQHRVDEGRPWTTRQGEIFDGISKKYASMSCPSQKLAPATRTWKDGYLIELDAVLQWQQQTERLFKETVRRGLSSSNHLLGLWKRWMIQDQTNDDWTTPANLFLGLTKQSAEAVVATVEPLLKRSEAAFESTFGYYETAVAAPSRKYVREINKQLLSSY
jgi:hypothetical protein